MQKNLEEPKLKYLKSIGGFHGVSAIFPKLKDIIDYEEKKIKIIQGYPRFVTHPLVKKIENKFKQKYGAQGALCCHSYESAVFLIIDYYFRKGNKLFCGKGLPIKIFNFLNRKFQNLADKTNFSQANIIIDNAEEFKTKVDIDNEVLIGLNENSLYAPEKIDVNFDILILKDKDNDIGIIIFYNSLYSEIDILRRHSGLIVSSRKLVKNKNISNRVRNVYEENLKKNISNLEQTNSNRCFLYPSGMAAVFVAIFSILSSQKSKIIALGSLYVDTIRILEKWLKKYGLREPIFVRDNFVTKLTDYIDEETAGIIFEIPSNPLIQVIDIEKIISIAHSKNAKVIVDNTIATPYNLNPFNYDADIIVHSTTKFLNGRNNHIGGVLLINDKEVISTIKRFNDLTNLDMSIGDMKVLTRNLKNFEKRMEKINKNSEFISKFLNEHKSVERVYYPALKKDPNYSLMQKYLRGASGLISFTLKNSSYENAEKFYNNLHLPFLKGPSLGSEKTLLCPYVVLAHFNDTKKKLKDLGLDFYLMRISVGTEPVEKIISSLEYALNFVD